MFWNIICDWGFVGGKIGRIRGCLNKVNVLWWEKIGIFGKIGRKIIKGGRVLVSVKVFGVWGEIKGVKVWEWFCISGVIIVLVKCGW